MCRRLQYRLILFEISFEQTLECLAVSCLFSSHFMDCVMNRVEVGSLGSLGEVCLAFGCAEFSFDSHFEVLLCGIGDYFAEQFSELGSVFSFFIGSLFIIHADFRIAFPESDSCQYMPTSG